MTLAFFYTATRTFPGLGLEKDNANSCMKSTDARITTNSARQLASIIVVLSFWYSQSGHGNSTMPIVGE